MQVSMNSFNPNFGARIKMKAPDVKALTQSAIGTVALGSAAASAAEFGVSVVALNDDAESYKQIAQLGEIPKEALHSHRNLLTSAGGRYDAAGYVEGIPVQSTIFPSVPIASAVFNGYGASNATNLASGENLASSGAILKDSAINSGHATTKVTSNKITGITSGLATTGSLLYGGFSDGAEALELSEKAQNLSAILGVASASTAALPIINSGTKLESSKFIGKTLMGEDTDKDKKIHS